MKRGRSFLFCLFFLLGYGMSAQAQNEWQNYSTRHFQIYYKDAPEDFVKSVEVAAENEYEEITQNLGFTRYLNWAAQNRCSIYIYRDQQDYMSSAKQEGWSHGAAYYRQKEIRTFPAAYGFFDTVLPHELGHIIFREFVGSNVTIPLWLDEGVAMYQERAKRWGAHKIVKGAIRDGRFIGLPALSNVRLSKQTDNALVDLFYAEAASVVYYMITDLGENRFVALCRKLQEGLPFDQALHKTYTRFRSLEDLNRAWLDYLDRP